METTSWKEKRLLTFNGMSPREKLGTREYLTPARNFPGLAT